MFFRSRSEGGHRKKGGGVMGIFRLLLSLIVIACLFFALYAAYSAFNPKPGTPFQTLDTIRENPKAFFQSLLSSDEVYDFVTTLLSFSPTKVNPSIFGLKDPKSSPDTPNPQNTPTNSPLSFRFAVVSDSHNDNTYLQKALLQARSADVKFVIGLGDYTDVGTKDELQAAKNVFEQSGLTYYSTAGDHDLWDARNRKTDPVQNYNQVFGSPYSSFIYQNTRFVLIFNSDNYLGVDSLHKKWIEEELERSKSDGHKALFVFSATPLYHPTSDHQMGRVTPKLKAQAQELLSLFKNYNVSEAFAGDTHFHTRYSDPATGLKMTTIGAATSVRNPQAPRFAIIDVFDDGSYNIEDREIK